MTHSTRRASVMQLPVGWAYQIRFLHPLQHFKGDPNPIGIGSPAPVLGRRYKGLRSAKHRCCCPWKDGAACSTGLPTGYSASSCLCGGVRQKAALTLCQKLSVSPSPSNLSGSGNAADNEAFVLECFRVNLTAGKQSPSFKRGEQLGKCLYNVAATALASFL